MKVLNNKLPIYISNYKYVNQNQQPKYKLNNNNYSVSFTAVPKFSGSSCALLPEMAKKQMASINENLTFIKNFFSALKTNPVKATKIRKGFSNLIPVSNNGFTFRTGKNSNINIARDRKNSNIIMISIQEDKNIKHFLIDGGDKVISNTNQNKPTMLPQKIKYMNENEMKNSQVQYYIAIAGNNLSDYAKYLKGLNLQPQKQVVKLVKSNSMSKITDKNSDIYGMVKKSVNSIRDLFSQKPQDLPSHITPQIDDKTGKIKSLSVKTLDGGELRFAKRLNPIYKDSLTYLAFEKTKPDGTQSYMSIDLNTYRFLKMKEKSKPLIREHSVYEYDIEEVQKRNFLEKLEEYIKEIKRKPQEKRILTSAKKSNIDDIQINKRTDNLPVQAGEKFEQVENIENNIEKKAQEKAINDAKLFSDTYFSVFAEQVKLNLKAQFEKFSISLDEIIKGLFKQHCN